MLKHFNNRRRNIKTLTQLAQMKDEDRRSLLRSIDDDQYKDVMKVLRLMPSLSMNVRTEVVDDEEQHVVTAGAIVTVTISITRESLSKFMGDSTVDFDDDDQPEEMDIEEEDENEVDKDGEEKEDEKKKGPAWKKPQQKKKTKKSGKAKQKQKCKGKDGAQSTKQNGES